MHNKTTTQHITFTYQWEEHYKRFNNDRTTTLARTAAKSDGEGGLKLILLVPNLRLYSVVVKTQNCLTRMEAT